MNLKQAKLDLDAEFGKNFSNKNPELVIRYLQAVGLNTLGEQLSEFSSEQLQGLNEVSKSIESMSFSAFQNTELTKQT